MANGIKTPGDLGSTGGETNSNVTYTAFLKQVGEFPDMEINHEGANEYREILEIDRNSSIYPEKIYINCPYTYASLIIGDHIDKIDSSPQLNRERNNESGQPLPITIVLKNNNSFSITGGYLNFLYTLEAFLTEKGLFGLLSYIKLSVLDQHKQGKSSKDIALYIYKRLQSLGLPKKESERVEKLLKECDRLVATENNQATIEGFYLKDSDFIPFNQKERLIKLLENDNEYQLLRNLLGINEEYVYRALTIEEREDIKNKKGWLIKTKTNFEKEIGPQVSMYAQEAGYAGIVIRIKAEKNNFQYAGFQVARIECYAPHFTDNIEVLGVNGEWLNLDTYLETLQ